MAASICALLCLDSMVCGSYTISHYTTLHYTTLKLLTLEEVDKTPFTSTCVAAQIFKRLNKRQNISFTYCNEIVSSLRNHEVEDRH